jgi:hypothetical protein
MICQACEPEKSLFSSRRYRLRDEAITTKRQYPPSSDERVTGGIKNAKNDPVRP